MIGQESKHVLAKNGGEYVRVHISRLIYCTNVDFKPVMENQNESVNAQISSDEVTSLSKIFIVVVVTATTNNISILDAFTVVLFT